MPRIHYHPYPQALGEYNYLKDTIILHEGLKKYRKIHYAILRHEKEHARIFSEHRNWGKRLILNVRLDYHNRITGATNVPIELLNELSPINFIGSIYPALYILAYLPIYLAEGFIYTIKMLLGYIRKNNLRKTVRT